MLKSLFGYVQHAKSQKKEEFLWQHPHSVLVLEPFKSIFDSDTRFETVDKGEVAGTVTTVAELAKRPGSNAFAQMITIGRAGNNDVIVKGAGISKFHAYVMTLPGKPARITDAGSTYGTFVRGEKLAARAHADLMPGDQVTIGSVRGVFHDPASFWDYLQGVISDPAAVQL